MTGNATGLVITVDDDTPIATAGTSTGTVDEDGVAGRHRGRWPGRRHCWRRRPDDGWRHATTVTGSVAGLLSSLARTSR